MEIEELYLHQAKPEKTEDQENTSLGNWRSSELTKKYFEMISKHQQLQILERVWSSILSDWFLNFLIEYHFGPTSVRKKSKSYLDEEEWARWLTQGYISGYKTLQLFLWLIILKSRLNMWLLSRIT